MARSSVYLVRFTRTSLHFQNVSISTAVGSHIIVLGTLFIYFPSVVDPIHRQANRLVEC